MSTPLLRSKLFVPPVRAEWVPRPRLIERLNAGLHRKLTLISAPAGFGKTTLLAKWIRHVGVHGYAPSSVAWLGGSAFLRDDDLPAALPSRYG